MRIGIDIGGTFTDVAAQGAEGSIALKVPSSPNAPEEAVIAGLIQAMKQVGVTANEITDIFHGTTVGSNTLLQRVGAKTGLLTTKGFRDVLEIGRLRTPEMFDLTWKKPEPLVRRRHRMEIEERIDGRGAITTGMNEEDVRRAARFLVAEGVEAVAICFINSYLNATHENRAAEILRKEFPELDVSVSAEILPVAREYERTSTVCVNAYVKKEMGGYLERLEAGIRDLGIIAPIYVSNSNGGAGSIGVAKEQPVFFISSGRSAGAVGAQRLGARLGHPNYIAFDMGGTTASAALVQDGALIRTDEYEFRDGISMPSRFIKAGGYLMRVPAIDVAEVGSGAGSIANVDRGGLLEVGPRSAGADPGPACYGKGGKLPTVTDANVVLGYISGDLAGSALSLDAKLSRHAIQQHVSNPLDVDVTEAAHGIRQVVNVNMARVIRAVTVERGVDPRDFDLLAFGGSGPVHACDLARTMGIERIVFPTAPGVFTATGLLGSRQEIYDVAAIGQELSNLDPGQLDQQMAALGESVRARMLDEGADVGDLECEFELDLRFVEQDGTLPVALTKDDDAFDHARIRECFLAAYREIYGYASTDAVEVVNLRVTCFVKATEAATGRISAAENAPRQAPSVRSIHFGPDFGWQVASVYPLGQQPQRVSGPAVIAANDSTIVVAPDFSLETRSDGTLIAHLQPAAEERIAS